MNIPLSPVRLSNAVLVVLFLQIGFIPIELNILAFYQDDKDWQQFWYNESLAWALLFLIFIVLAAFLALRRFKQWPIFSLVISALAVLGSYLDIGAWWRNGLGSSSKMDAPNLEMWKFWWTGGGWLALLVVVPLIIFYSVLRYRESKS